MNPLPSKITKEKVLAVEGDDEVNFMLAIMRRLEASEVDIFCVGGQHEFKNKMPLLVKIPGFSSVKSLAIIRDAENNKDSTFRSVQSTLRKCKLQVPNEPFVFTQGIPKIGVFIMPGTSQGRMLEDLCLMTVEKNPIMKCVTLFCDCVTQDVGPFKNIEKAKCQTYLAAMPKIVNSVGLGALKGYWDFDASCLEKLKVFLREL